MGTKAGGLLLTGVSGLLLIFMVAIGQASSPLPEDTFLTLSVSTRDAAVETRINGVLETFLSGGKTYGALVSSAPINSHVKEGENTIQFSLSLVDHGDPEPLSPALFAILEIHRRGEVADTMSPGERVIFVRELTDDETTALQSGEDVLIIETFQLEPERS